MNHEAIEQYYTRHYHSKVAKLLATLRATLERTQSAIEKRTSLAPERHPLERSPKEFRILSKHSGTVNSNRLMELPITDLESRR